jgi:AcrR family transcriptional regulator
MARPSFKEAMLDAAEEIVVESGAAHLTLDAVAERSGVSKGGLMYHFPTKDALLTAMMQRMMDVLDEYRQKARATLSGEDKENHLLVEILSGQLMSGKFTRLSAALLAVGANRPELAKPFSEKHRDRLQKEIVADRPFERASILFLADLGLHFLEIFNFSFYDEAQRDRIFKELTRLATSDACSIENAGHGAGKTASKAALEKPERGHAINDKSKDRSHASKRKKSPTSCAGRNESARCG